jgi:hypothetical protein
MMWSSTFRRTSTANSRVAFVESHRPLRPMATEIPRGGQPGRHVLGQTGPREGIVDRELGGRGDGELQPGRDGQRAERDQNRSAMTAEHLEERAEKVEGAS